MLLTLLAATCHFVRVAPDAVHGQREQIRLETIDLRAMTQDWGAPGVAVSVENHPLSIGGQSFTHGVGTHAHSEILIGLSGGATAFDAMVGVDDEVRPHGSVEFQVYVDGKLAARSGVLRGGDAPRALHANLESGKFLRLEVTDAGDGIDFDHADWADARIEVLPGHARDVQAAIVPKEPPMPISMRVSRRPEINGPRVLGTTPGHDFIFRIPVSGARPFHFRASGLPQGLSLDANRGIISGRVVSAGRYDVELKVDGPAGKDARHVEIVAGRHKLALTPPMGWNSWNVWATSVDADKVRAAADSLVKSGLADFGYQYVNIDDAWEGGRDAHGNIETNSKFGDMAALATYVHGLGLRLGIYSSPGPKTCAGYEASYQHEYQDAKSYADWGVDYLKYDWCSYGQIKPRPDLVDMQAPYRLMRLALDDSGRDIVFSLCQYGMGDVYKWGKQVGGNLWRTTGDITDTWNSMSGIAFSHSEKAFGASPGGWNDPDMLVVGNLGWGPHPRPSRLSPNEQITHISMWSMLAAPLIIGCDLTTLDEFTKALLTNHDVIDIDQDPRGEAATRRHKQGDTEVWARPLFDGTYAVALCNRGPLRARVRVDWHDLAPVLSAAELPVRDLWRRRDVGSHAGGFATEVPAHGTVLLKVGFPEKAK